MAALGDSATLSREYCCCNNAIESNTVTGAGGHQSTFKLDVCERLCKCPESVGCCRKAFRQRFLNPEGQTAWVMNTEICCAACPYLYVEDGAGTKLAELKAPSCMDRLKNAFSCGSQVLLRVLDAQGERKYTIRSQRCRCQFCCFSSDCITCKCMQPFKDIYDICAGADSKEAIGNIVVKGSFCGLIGRGFSTTVTFPGDAGDADKFGLVGAAYLFDNSYAGMSLGLINCAGDRGYEGSE